MLNLKFLMSYAISEQFKMDNNNINSIYVLTGRIFVEVNSAAYKLKELTGARAVEEPTYLEVSPRHHIRILVQSACWRRLQYSRTVE